MKLSEKQIDRIFDKADKSSEVYEKHDGRAQRFISTYGLKCDWSYRREKFKSIALTWKLGVSRIEALKIRIGDWKPKHDRSNQAVFYFDVETENEADEILEKFEKFDFRELENRFDEWFDRDCVRMRNTGDTQKWLSQVVPTLRSEFSLNTSITQLSS